MKKLVFATNNLHKLNEVQAMFNASGLDVGILSLSDINCHDDIPETASTLEGNALIKARYIYNRYGMSCFADDTGLEVDALGGAPGVHTARYANETGNDPEANIRKLLSELNGISERRARFRTVIALIENGEEKLFEGTVEGEITTERRGTEGFGYDPVFAPDETRLTFAETGPDIKNRISHRARAVKALCDYLNQH